MVKGKRALAKKENWVVDRTELRKGLMLWCSARLRSHYGRQKKEKSAKEGVHSPMPSSRKKKKKRGGSDDG